jgi:hypothetical protein
MNDPDDSVGFGVCNQDNGCTQQPYRDETPLPVRKPIVFVGQGAAVEDIQGIPKVDSMLAEIRPSFDFIPFELDDHCSYILELHQVAVSIRKLRLQQVQKLQFAGKWVTGLSEIDAKFRPVLPSVKNEGSGLGQRAARIDTDRRCHAPLNHSKPEGAAN